MQKLALNSWQTIRSPGRKKLLLGTGKSGCGCRWVFLLFLRRYVPHHGLSCAAPFQGGANSLNRVISTSRGWRTVNISFHKAIISTLVTLVFYNHSILYENFGGADASHCTIFRISHSVGVGYGIMCRTCRTKTRHLAFSGRTPIYTHLRQTVFSPFLKSHLNL